ncbi:MAG: MgtC/SapB family protein [Acidobacteriia bacterium]|nr:MgtC/SapB family protein [Terriglobia bacterium]
MPTTLTWTDIALRLALTAAAGALFGINRSEKGRSAGLRTTLLVSLAACIAMILANKLTLPAATPLPTGPILNPGDPLRIPLGVLSGMGFIGAGAIIRRENLIIGVTTAATVWFVTIMGLCFGSGQLALGAVAGALGLGVLGGLTWAEDRLPRDRRAVLVLTMSSQGPGESAIRSRIEAGGFQTVPRGVVYDATSRHTVLTLDVNWHSRKIDSTLPAILRELAADPAIVALNWREAEPA